jgi:hypothetical protein
VRSPVTSSLVLICPMTRENAQSKKGNVLFS